MKAWKDFHYERASTFLALLAGDSANASASPVQAPAPEPEKAASETSAPPPPAPVATAPNPGETTPPMATVLPKRAPEPVAEPVEETTPAPAAPAAPIKITPKPSAADRAPREAGRFFSGIAWAGGEAAFEAANEPDTKPGVSIEPARNEATESPPDRSNPILAATRSALVTAEKVAAEPPASTTEPAELPSSPTTPESTADDHVEVAEVEGGSATNAASFFKNLNWKQS
ncbi:MAG: hypothetical protein SynsKO_36080 [Synoicihabitans sp.]